MSRIGRGKDFEKNKSRLLHIVAKMFLERGYHRTTLRDISRSADIAYSSLINIFGSKEGILSELVALVFEYQFETAGKLLAGITDDKILLYAVETTLQLYMAESHEHIREMYSVSYSLPETSRIVYGTVTKKLEKILAEHLPSYETSDFYRLEIAAGGIMRSFMTVPADIFFQHAVFDSGFPCIAFHRYFSLLIYRIFPDHGDRSPHLFLFQILCYLLFLEKRLLISSKRQKICYYYLLF